MNSERWIRTRRRRRNVCSAGSYLQTIRYRWKRASDGLPAADVRYLLLTVDETSPSTRLLHSLPRTSVSLIRRRAVHYRGQPRANDSCRWMWTKRNISFLLTDRLVQFSLSFVHHLHWTSSTASPRWSVKEGLILFVRIRMFWSYTYRKRDWSPAFRLIRTNIAESKLCCFWH